MSASSGPADHSQRRGSGLPTAREWIAQGARFETSTGHSVSFRVRGKGTPLLMLHGFPTWSYDYAAVATELERDHRVVTLDFLGYGASDKPRGYHYTVAESADVVEELLHHLAIDDAILVLHNYGGIVGQELLDRLRSGRLAFEVGAIHLLNCGVVYDAYRPTGFQRALATPVLGPLVSRLITKRFLGKAISSVRREPLSPNDFDELWTGISLSDGHRLAHEHIRYNAERDRHHRRWQSALEDYSGELQLIWGIDDPVSGRTVLDAARGILPRAHFIELDGIGHFPQSEAPEAVVRAIRSVA
ncbi:alpha/beta hydrolase [Gordonia sp. CPCC 206044]|uniref:alpha/beta fold hydrolase n=1 Tax=Gordonia sp. CPCC 206044 TaxID=3140793 RepID=UPI003AF37916